MANDTIGREIFKAVLSGIVGIIVGITVAIFPFYYLGKSKGGEGTNPEFSKISTQLNLDGTIWSVSYEDASVSGPVPQATQTTPTTKNSSREKTPSPLPVPTPKLATVSFTQVGSRVVGQGHDSSGRTWIIEGAAAERRLCYIYYDSGGQRLSFGTVLMEINNAGNEMRGQWVGWSPESNELKLRKVTLNKQ